MIMNKCGLYKINFIAKPPSPCPLPSAEGKPSQLKVVINRVRLLGFTSEMLTCTASTAVRCKCREGGRAVGASLLDSSFSNMYNHFR